MQVVAAEEPHAFLAPPHFSIAWVAGSLWEVVGMDDGHRFTMRTHQFPKMGQIHLRSVLQLWKVN